MMRINGTHEIGPRDLSNSPNPPSKPSRSADAATSSASESDPTVESQLKTLIGKAKASEEINSQAVAEARKLLKSGELDTPDAIRRAAEAIIRFGP